MILIIDNYDSFTFNLYQYIGTVRTDLKVIRNDELTVDEILGLRPDKIIVSPGPGYPKDAGVVVELIAKNKDIPLLGVCLGHQAIGKAFGGTIIKASEIVHGKRRTIDHTGNGLFEGIPTQFQVVRYHSLVIDQSSMPDELETIATGDEEIMAVKHKERPIYGVQFHPESHFTEYGLKLIQNFLEM